MKLLLVVHGVCPEYTGGCEIYVEHLARGLAAAGHSCSILAGTGRSDLDPGITRVEGGEVPVLLLRRPDRLMDYWIEGYSAFAEEAFEGLIRREGYDLVHVHHWKRLSVNLAQVCARCGVPALLTIHDLWSTCPREHRLIDGAPCDERAGSPACPSCVGSFWWQGEAEVARAIGLHLGMLRGEFEGASRVLVPTETHRARIARALDLDPSCMEVFPLAVPASRLGPPTEHGDEHRFPRGPLELGFWGHLVPFKGPHVLLEALKSVGSPDRVHLHMFGEALTRSYRLTLDRLTRRMPVTHHGRFEARDLRRVPLDLAVVPSLCAESFSLVVEEAFQMGLPVLASDAGALAERIGGAGLLFRRGDARDLAARIDQILQQPSLLAELRRHIRKRVPQFADHVRTMEGMYREALRRRVTPGPPPPYLALLDHRARMLESRRELLVKLKAEADRAENLEGNLERYRAINLHLDAERREQRKVIADLRANLSGHRESLETREREVKELGEVAAHLRANLSGHRESLSLREREVREQSKVIAELKADLAGHRAVLEESRRHNENLREIVDESARDLQGHRKVLAEIRADLASHRKAVAALRAERSALRGELAQARETMGRMESLQRARHEELERLSRELEETSRRYRLLRADRTQVLARLQDREDRIGDLERRLTEIANTLVFRVYRALSPRAKARLVVEAEKRDV